MNYDKYEISKNYCKSRELSILSLEIWIKNIKKYLPKNEIKIILDLGCGTGRFTKILTEYFNAKAIGIDPSKKMLKEAKNKLENINFIEGKTEDIPLQNKFCDLIFLSMVYHHINDKKKSIREINRVLKMNRYLCIRNSTVNTIMEIPYNKYFPKTIEINKNRLPERKILINNIIDNGFKLIVNEVIKESISSSFKDFYNKIKLRGLSDLILISDFDFNNGLEMMKNDIIRYKGEVFEPIDLFIFQKIN